MKNKEVSQKGSRTFRTLEEVNLEYQQTCLRAGDLQYRILKNPQALEVLNARLVELDLEAEAIRRATPAAPPAASPAEKEAQAP